ncbi:uncharacterized protein LOC124259181 [Haliotis rubra]|uniref:uncharacterized protein LOC124259181 n=1 Tax=Haliotis rubra TaxID=36100 RepID=UPI001EE51DAB|nr:uncharacterized protein LOC124259181 [Haliotis rubra]
MSITSELGKSSAELMAYQGFKIRRLRGDVAIHTINSLSRLEKRHILSSNHLTFLMRCRDQQIIPKGLQLRSPVQSVAAKTILHQASRKLHTDHERIRHHRKIKATTTAAISYLHTSVNNTLEPELFSSLRTAQTTANTKLDTSTKNGHIMKLQQLATSATKSNEYRATNIRIVNISNKPLTNHQVDALAKGLKFAPTSARVNSDIFIANIEKGLHQPAPGGKVDYLRHQISNILQKAQPQKPNITTAEKKPLSN